MRFSRRAVMTVLCAPLVAAFSPGLNNNRQKAVFPIKQRDTNINKKPVGPLNVGEEVNELVKIVDLSSVFLLLAPAAAFSAGLVAQLQRGKLNEQVASTEEDLEKIRNQIKSTETAITTSTAVTIASAGFVAANALGLLPNSLAPDGSSAPLTSIATPQETLVENASSDAELAAAPRQEEEGGMADDDDAVAEEKQAEDTGEAGQMPSASTEEAKPHSNFFGLPAFHSPEPKAKAPALVPEETVEETTASDTLSASAGDATASTVESTTADDEKATTATVPAASAKPTTAEEEKAVAAADIPAASANPTVEEVGKIPAQSAEPTIAEEEKAPAADTAATAEPIAEDKPVVSDSGEDPLAIDEKQKPSVGDASTPPASETPKSESVFDELMKKMEMTGKVVEEATTPPASETPKSESASDELRKNMEMAGKAGIDGVEAPKEKPVESVKDIAKPEETSSESIVKSADSVFDDLMKRMEQAGKAGAESVEAAKEKVSDAIEDVVDALSGVGEDVESAKAESASEEATEAVGAAAASIPKLQVRVPEFANGLENIDTVALQGAAVLTFGAIAAAAVIAASDSGGTGSTFTPGTKSKGTGYLDGLTRSSASLASKGTKGPTSYLDTLKTPSSSMSSSRTGAGAGASYLDAISPNVSATKKSYSFSGKKPIKTGSSESPVKTLAPSGSYKAAPVSSTTNQPAVPLSPVKVTESPALAPLVMDSQLSGPSAAPKKSFSPYGTKPPSTVGAGSMGSSTSYLSSMSSSTASFVSPSVAPSGSSAPPPPVATATVITPATSQAAPKALYSPFGNKPEVTGTTGTVGSSSSYLSGIDVANGAGASYSSGPSLPPPPSPPTSYSDTSQATPKKSYSPFGGGPPKFNGGAGTMGSSSSYLTGMGTSGTNGDWQSQPAYSPPSTPPVEPARQSSPSKSYAPMTGKPKAVSRAGPGSYLDAL